MLNKEINASLADPKLKARLSDLGGTVLPSSPADFVKLIAEETEKWGKLIRAANIKPRRSFSVGGGFWPKAEMTPVNPGGGLLGYCGHGQWSRPRIAFHAIPRQLSKQLLPCPSRRSVSPIDPQQTQGAISLGTGEL
jgi:hypothetical protein